MPVPNVVYPNVTPLNNLSNDENRPLFNHHLSHMNTCRMVQTITEVKGLPELSSEIYIDKCEIFHTSNMCCISSVTGDIGEDST